jgi:raffinose/stachyose/melibiose transport system permease protein
MSRRRTAGVFRGAASILLVAAISLPLYIGLISAFKNSSDIVRTPLLPVGLTLDNIVRVLTGDAGDSLGMILNSLLITTFSLFAVTLFAAMLAFHLNRRPGMASRITLLVLLVGLMLPGQILLVPLVQVLRTIGLMGTFPGLFLFNVGYYLPFGVLLFVGALRAIPLQIDEAAQIDGASSPRIFFEVYLPLLRPAMASVCIIVGVWIWNDFLNPLIILGPAFGTTATVGIYRAIGQYSSDYGVVFALSFVAMVPVIAMFLVLQKYFVKGLVSGGIKG